MQAVHALDGGRAVAGLACRAEGLAVGLQRCEEHGQHVGGKVGLAGGKAQAFGRVEHG
ncbi:hypothetical protein D9M73_234060 [compost metagenome]